MSYTFCTIITESHLAWACTLYASIKNQIPDALLSVLVVDGHKEALQQGRIFPEGITIVCLDALKGDAVGDAIMAKYAQKPDELRWSLKSIFMLHLLHSYEKVLYCDCDLFFFSDPTFLIDSLNENSILLTPHWRNSVAAQDITNYNLLLNAGLYNAGFIAANRTGGAALAWWAANCLTICVKDPCNGQYVDQAHLNLMPIYFEGVHVLKHQGCNVANWNISECRRTVQGDRTVLINDRYPIVFIHFTKSMVVGVLSGKDPDLTAFLEQFNSTLKQYDSRLDLIARGHAELEQQRLARELKKSEGYCRLSLLQRLKLKLLPSRT